MAPRAGKGGAGDEGEGGAGSGGEEGWTDVAGRGCWL
jgi:hypothetical protein